PYRGNGALLAKRLATVDAIARGGGCKPASPLAGAPTTTRQRGLCSPEGPHLRRPARRTTGGLGTAAPGIGRADRPGPRRTPRPAAADRRQRPRPLPRHD